MKRSVLISIGAVAMAVGVGTVAVFAAGGPDATADPATAASDVVQTAPEVSIAPVPTPEVTESDDIAVPTPTPTPTATPTVETSADIASVQQTLADLGYYVGAIDGRAGPATASAVQAFQKVQGLGADGVIGPNTVAALSSPRVPSLRGGPANRVEVDLDTQVLYLVQGGELARILPISSGSGATYTNPGGGTARSLTPVGDFTVERHIRGVRNAPLGTLYDPMYFHSGWAIHGSNSVPAHPASHGCVRVTRADAQWLFDRVPIGTTVSIYGNTNAFSPALGESAGTSTPAGDTAETTPDDGIQTEVPTAPTDPTPPGPAPTTPPAPTPTQPTPAPVPSQPTPTDPTPTQPAPTQPPPATPPPPDPEPPARTSPPIGSSAGEVAPAGAEQLGDSTP